MPPIQHIDGPVLAPKPVPCPDFELPSMVTSDDFWEAAFRREVQKNIESSTSSSSSSSRNNAISKRADKGDGEGEDEGVARVALSSTQSSFVPMASSNGALKGHSTDKDRNRNVSEKESVMTIEKQKVDTCTAFYFLRNLVGLDCCTYHALPCPVLSCPISLTTFSPIMSYHVSHPFYSTGCQLL
jgi:hypothetical protein